MRSLFFSFAALLSLASIVLAQDDPFTQKPAAATEKAGWSGSSIGVEWHSKVFFGPRGCPAVVVDEKVYSIKSGKEISKLDVMLSPNRSAALSDDGRLLAIGDKYSGKSIYVFDTVTGDKLWEIPRTGSAHLWVRISLNKYVIANTSADDVLDVWSIEKKEKIKTIKFEKRVDTDKLDFSGDGKYYCFVEKDNPVVAVTASGKVVAQLAMSEDGKAPTGKRGLPSPAKDPEAYRAALKAKMNASFTTAWMKSLSFSPEGDEIAAYSSHPNPRLLCWNAKGKLIYDIPIPDVSRGFDSNFYWLPDKSGWIVNGLLIDRASKRTVMQFKGNPSVAVIDKERLVGRFGEDATKIEQFTIPWEEIRKSVKAMDAKEAAIIASYQPVSVEVVVEKARGDAAELQRVVLEGITKRLERDGVAVKEGQATKVRVTISESAGEQLPIFERTSRFDFRGHDTGRKATEAKSEASIEVIAGGEAIWRDRLQSSNATSFDKEITDATVRQSMLERLSSQLNRLNLPYFIPKSEELLALPVTVQ
jgi:hypothetical protein